MTRKLHWLGAVMLSGIVAAGCGPKQETPAPTPTVGSTPFGDETSIPVAPTSTVDPAGDPSAPPTYTFQGLSVSELENSTSWLTLAFMGRNAEDAPSSLTTNATLSGRKSPFSQFLTMQYQAAGVNTVEMGLGEQANGQFSILVTPETAYVTQAIGTDAEACVSLAAASASPLITSLTSFDDLLGTSLPEMTRMEPNEVVGGMESRHYHLDNLANDKFTAGTFDVWVARDTGVVTRVVINGQGTFPNLGTGSMNASYELFSTQQTVDYSPPADCEPVSAP